MSGAVAFRAAHPENGCEGNLLPVIDQDLDADPRLGRLRREYRESPVFRIGLWAEEHTHNWPLRKTADCKICSEPASAMS